MRPSWLLFAPLLCAAELLRCRLRPESCWRVVVSMTFMCLVLAPWWIRNWRVTGAFVPTTLQIGASLYDGLNPRATGRSNMDFVRPAFQQLKQEDRRLGRPRSDFELRLNRRLRDEALDWAGRNPGRVCELAAAKFLRLWSPWPADGEFSRPLFQLLTFLGYVPLLGLAAGGLWTARHNVAAWLLLAPAAYLSALHMVFVSSIRYRQPAMLALIPAAAWFLVSLGSRKALAAGPDAAAGNASSAPAAADHGREGV
jgi:hypothetical protein